MPAASVLRASQLLPTKTQPALPSNAPVQIPRGALTEILGPESSGRTSLMCSLLAEAAARQEICAYIDVDGALDFRTAADAGVRLSQLLWVRTNTLEHALKAADLLANAGGFGLIALDLGDVPEIQLQRVPLAAWFRLRHTIENTRTSIVTLARRRHAHPCSQLKVELRRDPATPPATHPASWDGYLRGYTVLAETLRNHQRQTTQFTFTSGHR
jgi:recombination protein RecA